MDRYFSLSLRFHCPSVAARTSSAQQVKAPFPTLRIYDPEGSILFCTSAIDIIADRRSV